MVRSLATIHVPSCRGSSWTPEEPIRNPTSPLGPGGTWISIVCTCRAGITIGVTRGAVCSVPAGTLTSKLRISTATAERLELDQVPGQQVQVGHEVGGDRDGGQSRRRLEDREAIVEGGLELVHLGL